MPFNVCVFLQANRPYSGQHAQSDHGRGRMSGQSERSAIRRTRAVQDIAAILPAGQPAHRPHLAAGHHVHVAIRTSAGRGQLQLRRLAVLERALLGREGGRHVDDDHPQRRQPARQSARHTEKMAANILRHGHQPDTVAVRAIATVAAVRHIAATATDSAAATTTTTATVATGAEGRVHRVRLSVRSARRRTSFRHAVHIPHEHRGHTVAGRFPKSARSVCRRRKRNRGKSYAKISILL